MRPLPDRVIAAVISRGDAFLVCRRPLTKRFGGLWEFPGGKCEPGETDAETIRRELWEELDVEVAEVGVEDFVTEDPSGRFLLVFRPVQIRGEPVQKEHIDLRWIPLRDLLGIPLIEGDRRYVEFSLAKATAPDQAGNAKLT